MKTRNLIKKTLSQPESLIIVQQIREDNVDSARFAIADRVCEYFHLFNALGNPQKAGCLKPLRELEQAGQFHLSQVRSQSSKAGPRRLAEPVEEPRDLPSAAGEIQALELIRVETKTKVRIWDLMIQSPGGHAVSVF